MKFARIDGLTMHYRVHGPDNGPVLAFSNSLGTDARIWDGVIERMASKYRIVSYDQRGHGLSDAPSGPYKLDDHVDDLANLLDHLGVKTLALCGVSVGGQIAQRFATKYQSRLRGLVLCDTAAKIGDASMWEKRIAAIEAEGIASIATAVLERWFGRDYREQHPAEYAGWRNMLERMPAQGYIATCQAIRDADLSGEVGSIVLPTLVLAGSEDLSTPPDIVRKTAALLPNARFEIIENAGHIPSIEQPDALAALIQHYLDEVGHG
jgi:3-oxoadipate enol-lactonase